MIRRLVQLAAAALAAATVVVVTPSAAQAHARLVASEPPAARPSTWRPDRCR